METPFVFGRIATEKNFTDRGKETASLVEQFRSLINTIIISPRRWGKSSLVAKAAKIAMEQDNNLRICHIDLFNVRDEAQFYSLLAQKIIAATSSRWDEAVENAKRFFSNLVPKISIGADQMSEVSIDFDWEEVRRSPDEILDLAERIARDKGLKIVVCIDEFQNIAEFTDADYFQRRLRSHWQQHQKVGYCLYGSKRHMMLEVFTDASKPFYKFGNLMFLDKIATPDLVDFFTSRFSETGKTITPSAALLIARLVDNHPYYAQQLAQLAWLRTAVAGVCDDQIVGEAHSSLVEQLSLLFATITEKFTSQQLNYLKAFCAGESSITSAETMSRYGISSATAAVRSRNTLIKNDILDDKAGHLSFQDPIFYHWLKFCYFNL